MYAGWYTQPIENLAVYEWDVKPYFRKKNRAVMADYYWVYGSVPNHQKGWNVLTSHHAVQWIPAGEGYHVRMPEPQTNYYINKVLGIN
jgi:hypothetical protein